jgi:hypothetical protein
MPARGLAVYGALCLAAFCEAAHAAPEGIIELDHATLVATVTLNRPFDLATPMP